MISPIRTIKISRAATHAVPMLLLIFLCMVGVPASADTPADELPLMDTAAAAGEPTGLARPMDGDGGNADLMPLVCSSPSFTLTAGNCDGIAPSVESLAKRKGAGPEALPPGILETTLPADGVLGPGKHLIDIGYASSNKVSCTSVVTVLPCKPVVVSGTVTVAPASGVCAGAVPLPSSVVTAATLGRGALSIKAFKTRTGRTPLSGPLQAGKYFARVVYPGDISSASSASSVKIAVNDEEAPIAGIKSTIYRDASGFICAVGRRASSTTACVSVSSASKSVLSVSDNCNSLTRLYKCSSGTCPTSAISSTATKLCVPVKAGGGRVETTFTMTVTDKGGRQANLVIPIAAYHRNNAPAGVKCYSA